jgi:surfeit locus 1 family protein
LALTVSAPRRAFRPRLAATLAVVAGLALFLSLGRWQYTKALRVEADLSLREQRQRMPPEVIGPGLVQPGRADAARFSARGHYVPSLQFFIDNRQHGGVAGLHVVTPLRIDGSQTLLLVNRGWTAWPRGRGVLPDVPVPEGLVQVTGLAQVPSTKSPFLMSPTPEPEPRLRARVDIDRFAARAGQAIQPVVLLQDPGNAQDMLVRHWPAPEDRSLKHRGYALQWFGMAAALAVFFVVAQCTRSPSVA